ncbi:30S ribosomal protein S20 [bacterium]|nr:30S ribosomal protein S20 [bacterium]
MPIKQNAKKALRQSIKRMVRNKAVKDEIKSIRVKYRKSIVAKEATKAVDIARELGKKLDKSVSKGVMKKNTVARLKSRMMKKLNAIKKA